MFTHFACRHFIHNGWVSKHHFFLTREGDDLGPCEVLISGAFLFWYSPCPWYSPVTRPSLGKVVLGLVLVLVLVNDPLHPLVIRDA